MTQTQTPPTVLYTPEELAARDAIRASQYFLLLNSGGVLGEVWRCDPKKGGCGAKHEYFTLRCVERPFSGLSEALYGYVKMGLGDPEKRARIRARLKWLESSHPLTARDLGATELGEEIISYSLGAVEPITRTKAQFLVDAINARGLRPPLRLRGINDGPAQVSPGVPLSGPGRR